jgi:hypothetical protein
MYRIPRWVGSAHRLEQAYATNAPTLALFTRHPTERLRMWAIKKIRR